MSGKEERALRSATRKAASEETASSGHTTSTDTNTWSNSTSDEQHGGNLTAPRPANVMSEGPAQPVAPLTYPAPTIEDANESDNDRNTVVGSPVGGAATAVSLSVLRAELELHNAELEQAQRAAAAARSRLELVRFEASSSAPQSNVVVESRVVGWVEQQRKSNHARIDRPPALLPPPPRPEFVPRREEQPRATASPFANRDFELLSNQVVEAVKQSKPAMQRAPELPPFDGNITEWIAFRAEFEDTAPLFSDIGNVGRLRRSLRGDARHAVKSIMYTVSNPYEILEALERHFGDPEEIVLAEIRNVKRMPKLADDNSNITAFAGHVANVVATIKSLRQVEFLYAPELVNKIIDKMNLIVRYEWNKYRALNKQLPGLEAMAQFLNDISSASRKTYAGQRQSRGNTHVCRGHCPAPPRPAVTCHSHNHSRYSSEDESSSDYEENVKPRTVAQVKTKKPVKKNALFNTRKQPTQQSTPTYSVKCIICSGEHKLSSCADFIKMQIAQRWEVARNSKLCFRCLDASHKKPYKCKYVACGVSQCEAGHHKLLHGLIVNTAPARAHVSSSINHLHKADTYLKIVPVELTGPLGVVTTYALLDDGSSITMIERHIADRVAPRNKAVPLSIEGVGGNVINDPDSCKIDISIRGACSRSLERLSAYTIDHLNLAAQSVNREIVEKCDHLRDIKDEICYERAVPTILVGQDHWNLLVSRQVRSGNKDLPVASLTSLGWILHGKHESNRKSSSFVVNHVKPTDTEQEVLTLMKEHFSIESLGIEKKVPKTDPDQRALDILAATCHKSSEKENVYQAGLLWRSDTETLPDNKNQALKRLHSLENKLDKDENLKNAYSKQIENLLAKGYAEVMQSPPPPDSPRVWYLPHFPVFHAQKLKIRLVFDAASRAYGKCLNDALLTGPDLLQSLFGVLLRFREGKIGVIADVREMFLQVEIAECDRDSLRFLWREGDRASPPKEYRMKKLIFGSACSPATALYVKNKNADCHAEQFPRAAIITKRNSYMDDYLIALDETEAEARQIINDVYELNSKASFELTGFASNQPSVIADVSHSKESSTSLGIKTESERTLGLIWNHSRDTLGFNVNLRNTPPNVLNGTKLPTKRQVTSSAMSIYDPLGYIAPISVIGKALIQDIWRTGIGWDDTILPESVPTWNNFIESIQQLKKLELSRYVPAYNRQGDLHVFCDASEKVYAAAVYFVSDNPNENEKTSSLVAAKARVAPLKTISIPRLELQSCVLGTRLADTVKKQTDYVIRKCHYWSDSRTVLAWIKADPRTFKSFVAHRLAEIEDATTPTEWRWVPSALNVADDATKGVPSNFDNKHRWFFGPDFIRQDVEKWPQDKSAPTLAPPTGEERPKTVMSVKIKNDSYLPKVDRFSQYNRLIRATATVLFVAEVFKAKLRKESHVPEVTNDHLRLAEILHIRQSQQESFGVEMKRLKNEETIAKGSKLGRIAVKLDKNGILLLDARCEKSAHIPVLHAKEKFTRLLIMHHHALFNHANHATVMNELNQRYHIVGLRGALRFICSRCQWCRTHRAMPKTLPIGDLPPERLTANQPPFTAAACDLFGPLTVTIGRRHEKRWGVLYTCLTTRAVHLELAASLTSSSLLLSLRRLMARRGTPTILYSDNATNFVGAEREISDALQTAEEAMKNFAVERRIIWKKIPPGNPAAGGAWERMVGSIKRALRVTLVEKNPTEEVLHTLLLEAEHIVNSRPLTPVMWDNNEALTPNHFLLGRSNAMSPFGRFADVTASTKSWHQAQQMAERFWSRWTREYRPLLKLRLNPRSASRENIQIGDIVIIVDGTMPRGTWPKGEVTKTFPGPDGITRVTEVRTAAGMIRRPASRLIVVSGQRC